MPPPVRPPAGSPPRLPPARRRVGPVLPAALGGRSLPRVRMLRLPERRLDDPREADGTSRRPRARRRQSDLGASGHGYIGQIGRTSTYPPSTSGIFLAHSTASCLVSQSIK